MPKDTTHEPRTLSVYTHYNFRTKDPVIDELRTMAQDMGNGKITHKLLTGIAKEGGLSPSTMDAWFFGKTRRPTSATVEAAGRAMGFKRKWVKYDPNNA